MRERLREGPRKGLNANLRRATLHIESRVLLFDEIPIPACKYQVAFKNARVICETAEDFRAMLISAPRAESPNSSSSRSTCTQSTPTR